MVNSMKQWLLGLILITSAILVSLWWFTRTSEVKNYPSPNSEIIAFGDSLIEGVGSTQGGDLVSLLSNGIGKPIRNFGRGGDTTAMALERLPSVLQEVPNPQLVIILLGGNDFLRRVPREETFENMKTIITKFQDRGAVVLLLGVRGGVIKDQFKEEFEILHDTYKTAYVSNILSGLIGNPTYMYDSVHPNNLGYEKAAKRILPTLQRYIQP